MLFPIPRSQRRPFGPSTHLLLTLSFACPLHRSAQFLYVALTRARVNVWIFDEDASRRAPAMELFLRRGLVTNEQTGGGGIRGGQVEGVWKTSTPKEWTDRGMNMYMAGLQDASEDNNEDATAKLNIALSCLIEAGKHDDIVTTQIRARLCLLQAQASKAKSEERKLHYREAALHFLQAESLMEAAVSLQNAGEHREAADLYMILGKVKSVAKCLSSLRDWRGLGAFFVSLGREAMNVADAVQGEEKVKEKAKAQRLVARAFKLFNQYDLVAEALALLEGPQGRTLGYQGVTGMALKDDLAKKAATASFKKHLLQQKQGQTKKSETPESWEERDVSAATGGTSSIGGESKSDRGEGAGAASSAISAAPTHRSDALAHVASIRNVDTQLTLLRSWNWTDEVVRVLVHVKKAHRDAAEELRRAGDCQGAVALIENSGKKDDEFVARCYVQICKTRIFEARVLYQPHEPFIMPLGGEGCKGGKDGGTSTAGWDGQKLRAMVKDCMRNADVAGAILKGGRSKQPFAEALLIKGKLEHIHLSVANDDRARAEVRQMQHAGGGDNDRTPATGELGGEDGAVVDGQKVESTQVTSATAAKWNPKGRKKAKAKKQSKKKNKGGGSGGGGDGGK